MEGRSLEAMRLLAHALLGSGRPAAACDLLRGVHAAAPGDLPARRGLVRSLLGLGRYAEAEPLARDLAERDAGPGRALALFLHAHALWGCGRADECRAAVERYAACGEP